MESPPFRLRLLRGESGRGRPSVPSVYVTCLQTRHVIRVRRRSRGASRNRAIGRSVGAFGRPVPPRPRSWGITRSRAEKPPTGRTFRLPVSGAGRFCPWDLPSDPEQHPTVPSRLCLGIGSPFTRPPQRVGGEHGTGALASGPRENTSLPEVPLKQSVNSKHARTRFRSTSRPRQEPMLP